MIPLRDFEPAKRRTELLKRLNPPGDDKPPFDIGPVVEVDELANATGPHILDAEFAPGEGLITQPADVPAELPAEDRVLARRWLQEGKDPDGRSWALLMVDGQCVGAVSSKGDKPLKVTATHVARPSERIRLKVPGVARPRFMRAEIRG